MPRLGLTRTLNSWRDRGWALRRPSGPPATAELDRLLSAWAVPPAPPGLAKRIAGQSPALAQARRQQADGEWPWLAAFPAAFALGLAIGFFATLANLDTDGSAGFEPTLSASAPAPELDEESDRL